METPAGTTKPARTAYADLLRCFAALCVVFLHVAAQEWYAWDIHSAQWKIFNLHDSLVRWTVPVFVMLSGMFLLDNARPLGVKRLLGKYVARIVAAFLFWAIFYGIFFTTSDFFLYGGWDSMNASARATALKDNLWPSIWRGIPGSIVNYSGHLWFLFILLGQYLLTPALRYLTRPESQKVTAYVILLWMVVTVLLPSIADLTGFTGFQWLTGQLSLSLVTGYVGYYLAGYFLRVTKLPRWASISLISLGICGLGATYFLTDWVSLKNGVQSETFYSNLSLNVMLAAFGVFTAFKTLFGFLELKGAWKAVLTELSACTFGIYLTHIAFIHLLNTWGFSNTLVHPLLAVPLKTLLAFLMSLMVTIPLRRIPFVGKYIF